jgi:hypothetical protein
MLVFTTFFVVYSSFAQTEFEFSGKRSRALIPFTKARGLVVLPVKINGKGPFNFILDSGVGNMVITNPKLKDSLNLQYLRKIKLAGLGVGSDIDAFSSPFLNVKIAGVQAKSISAAVLDDDIFNLSGYAGIQVDGLIGYDFFKSFLVRIDFEDSILKVYKNQVTRLIKKGHKIPISIENSKPYIDVLVDAGAEKKIPLKMLLDSGSGNPLSLESYNNGNFPLPDKFVIANLGVGLSGIIRGFKGRIDRIKIGKFHLDQVVASYPYYEDIAAKITSVKRNGSIGNTLLKKFDVLFDYQNSCIYLRPSANFKEEFEFDMSGIELVAQGDNYNRYFVSRVERGSPADELGVQNGDELIGLNFNAVSKFTFEEVIKFLSSKDGRTIYIEFARDGKSFAGVMTLKKRI